MKKFLLIAVAALTSLFSWGANGFHTEGTKLLDAQGNEFVMRGVNYSWAWQRGHEYSAIRSAKLIGSNVIRIQLNSKAGSVCSKEQFEELIRLCEENKLVAIFNTHDETGSNNLADLERARDFWISMKDVLNAHLSTVIVNVSNEWYGNWDSDKWAQGYLKVVPELRAAGIKNTLIIDAAGYGQYAQCIADRGGDILAADPDKNLVFSMHIYDTLGSSAAKVRYAIDSALEVGAPVIVGEFSYEHIGKPVAYKTVMKHCKDKNVGWLVWSWTGNGQGTDNCNMFRTYDHTYMLPNGTKTIFGENGLKATSKQCSVYGTETPGEPVYETVTLQPESPIVFTPDFRTSYQFPAKHFPTVRVGDKLRFHYTDAGAKALVQIVYKKAISWQWTQKDVNLAAGSGTYDHEVTEADMRDGLIWDGLHLKGQEFTLNKIEIIPDGHDIEVEPENVDDPEGEADPDYEGDVVELTEIHSYTFPEPVVFTGSWGKDYNIKETEFTKMQPGDYLRFSTTGAGQLQLAVKDANWTWLQFSPFYDIVGKDFDVKVEGTDYNKMTTAQIVDNLKLHGLFVKGTNHTLYGMKIMRPGQGGVEGIADDDAIDWNAPVEIYNLQGIRVAEASKGGIYIIRQGEKSVKVRK